MPRMDAGKKHLQPIDPRRDGPVHVDATFLRHEPGPAAGPGPAAHADLQDLGLLHRAPFICGRLQSASGATPPGLG